MRLASLLLLAIAAWAAWPGSQARAHRPYFGESRPIVLEDGSDATLRLLYGDGVFSSDPVQAVVVDDRDEIIAAGPVSTDLYLACGVAGAAADDCLAYDPFERTILTPDERSFVALGTLRDGRPTDYPSNKIATGFTSRPATFRETVTLEAMQALGNPLGFVLLALWLIPVWALILSLSAGPEEDTPGFDFAWIVTTVGKMLLALLLLAALLFLSLVFPFSEFSLALAAGVSGILVIAVKMSLRRRIARQVAIDAVHRSDGR